MPYRVVTRKKELITVGPSGVHGHFPRSQAGHRRAAGQIAIMERAEGKKKRRRGSFGRRDISGKS